MRQLPVYSDLLAPAPAPAGMEPARTTFQPFGSAEQPEPPTNQVAGPLPSPGQPAESQPGQPAPPAGSPAPPPPPFETQGAFASAAPSIPHQREPEQRPEPAQADDDDADPRSGPPVGVIVGAVIIGAALLVLIALGMPFLVQQLQSPAPAAYTVGECVVQDADNARVVECTHPGAFEITQRVDDRADCPDPALPTVAAGGDVLCLQPAAEGEGAGGPAAVDEDGDEDDPGDDEDTDE